MSLAIKGYDLILGMDWLARYHIQLNYKMKLVELCIPIKVTWKLDVRSRLALSALIPGFELGNCWVVGLKNTWPFL